MDTQNHSSQAKLIIILVVMILTVLSGAIYYVLDSKEKQRILAEKIRAKKEKNNPQKNEEPAWKLKSSTQTNRNTSQNNKITKPAQNGNQPITKKTVTPSQSEHNSTTTKKPTQNVQNQDEVTSLKLYNSSFEIMAEGYKTHANEAIKTGKLKFWKVNRPLNNPWELGIINHGQSSDYSHIKPPNKQHTLFLWDQSQSNEEPIEIYQYCKNHKFTQTGVGIYTLTVSCSRLNPQHNKAGYIAIIGAKGKVFAKKQVSKHSGIGQFIDVSVVYKATGQEKGSVGVLLGDNSNNKAGENAISFDNVRMTFEPQQ